MIRRTVIRLIALLLILNGAAGWVAVWAGWQASEQLLDDLREASTGIRAQQAGLVTALDGMELSVADAAETTAGFGRTVTEARAAASEASAAAEGLATIFERLSQISEVSVLGGRPLEPLAESFASSAGEFQRLSLSLGRTSEVLSVNARDVERMAADVRRIRGQLAATTAEIRAIRAMPVVEQGVTSLQFGTRVLLGVVFFEATLSALTGLALLMMVGLPTGGRSQQVGTGRDPDVRREPDASV